MLIASIHRMVRFHPQSLLLIILLVAAYSWASRPATAAANPAQFRVMLPLMLMTGPSPALDATPEQQVFALTNELRQQNGCPPLQLSPELSNAARGHSQDMADYNYFGHADRDGHMPAWRAQQAAYPGTAGTENIAAGYATAEDVVMGWYNETPPNDGHRRNLLNCSLTDVGIGYAINPNSDYHSYWTQDMGQR
jgi:uncharacterized protein YkwD